MIVLYMIEYGLITRITDISTGYRHILFHMT